MEAVFAPAFFILGAIVASFMGVVAERLYTGQSYIGGRSRCDACGEVLEPLNLVPIASFLFSLGRAHCCGARLSPRAPISEALLGTLFALAYLTLGLTPPLPLFLVALSALLALVRYDLAHQILPTPLLVVFVAASALTGFLLTPPPAFSATLLTALGIAAFLALIHVLSRGRAMGFADTPLVFGLALLVGPAAIPGLVFSFWLGAAVGITVLALRPVGSRMGVEVPFAPFLAAGFLLAYFTQWNPFIFAATLP